jgi:phage shock protein A
MGIFKRMKDIATADIQDTLDRIEDPISMLKQYIRELENQIQKGQAALANQLFIEKKYEMIIIELNADIEKRTNQAKLAVELDKDDVAKIALEEKLNLENKLTAYQTQLEHIQKQTTELVNQVNQLKEKHEELVQRKLKLISRANMAKTIVNVSESMVSFNSNNALSGFSRAEEKIMELEARAAVHKDSYISSGLANHKKLDVLVEHQIEVELAKLKETKVIQA